MASKTLHAPAKINLGLRIVGRRSDGYHLLESLFVPLALEDSLEIAVRSASKPEVTLELRSDDPEIPTGPENLAVQAAHRFLRGTSRVRSVHIRIDKRIPSGAGLGGGSSDAGAVLRALAELIPGETPDLQALALGLGADVPFFLDPRPARVSGVGEEVEAVSGMPPLWLLLAHPGPPLSTARVYREFDRGREGLTPESTDSTMAPTRWSEAERGSISLQVLTASLENDLEPAAIRLCPDIIRLREQLEEVGALGVGLSGSGPTLYGVFESESAVARAAARFGEGGSVRTWCTRSAVAGSA